MGAPSIAIATIHHGALRPPLKNPALSALRDATSMTAGMVGVGGTAMGYMQMVLGFFVGYIIIAFVLTPIFFKMNMVSIYQYLDDRFGVSSHKTGAWFFFISKILGAAVRLFLVCVTLQLMISLLTWGSVAG